MIYKPPWSGDYQVRPVVKFNGLCYHIHSAHDDGSPNVERRTEHHELFRYLKRKLPTIVEKVRRNKEQKDGTSLESAQVQRSHRGQQTVSAG